ncbi:uncharacterized protein LOC142341304 [Convolutriloba macropyga]|uniref:uncharacterized protein LOC142341304 n=1 Tax=Convolutriloba macropyga TaxID=536237 RepID=UPI003F528C7E
MADGITPSDPSMVSLDNYDIETTVELSTSDWEELYPVIAQLVFSLDLSCAIISLFGCVGNLLVMMIISKWRNMSSGAAFMFILALADLMSVFYDGIIDEALPLFGFFLYQVNDSICAACKYFSVFSTFASLYITVLFGIDKLLAVYFPFKYRQYGKPKVSAIFAICVYLVFGVYATYNVFVFRIHPETGFCRPFDFRNCFLTLDILNDWAFSANKAEIRNLADSSAQPPGKVNRKFFFEIRPHLNAAIGAYVPLSCSSITTTITIFRLKLSSRKRSANQNGEQANQSGARKQVDRRDAEIIRQMIMVCICFSILCVINSIVIVSGYRIEVKTARDEAMTTILDRILSNSLATINSANFYIYLIFGKKFRSDFLRLLGKEPRSQRATRSRQQGASAAS